MARSLVRLDHRMESSGDEPSRAVIEATRKFRQTLEAVNLARAARGTFGCQQPEGQMASPSAKKNGGNPSASCLGAGRDHGRERPCPYPGFCRRDGGRSPPRHRR